MFPRAIVVQAAGPLSCIAQLRCSIWIVRSMWAAVQNFWLFTNRGQDFFDPPQVGRCASVRCTDESEFLRTQAKYSISTICNDRKCLERFQGRPPERSDLWITDTQASFIGCESQCCTHTVARFHHSTAKHFDCEFRGMQKFLRTRVRRRVWGHPIRMPPEYTQESLARQCPPPGSVFSGAPERPVARQSGGSISYTLG